MEGSTIKYPKILITRHGESVSNKNYAEYRSTQTVQPDSLKIPLTNNLAIPFEVLMNSINMDCMLSSTGENQCREGGKNLDKMGYHIKYVFVSPLLRALETTRLMLSEYSHSSEIKSIKVWPELKETLLDLTSIPTDSNNLHYPHYDMSEIKDNLWILETDPENKIFQQIKKELINLNPSEKYSKMIELLKGAVKDVYPVSLENEKNVWERSLVVKDKIRAFIDEKRKSGEEIQDNEILLVGHFLFFMYFLATKEMLNESYYLKSPLKMSNCQLLSYQLEEKN